MNITLNQIIPVLETLGLGAGHVELAIAELHGLLAELDVVEVKGRENVENLLGCMVALEQIIGKEGDNG